MGCQRLHSLIVSLNKTVNSTSPVLPNTRPPYPSIHNYLKHCCVGRGIGRSHVYSSFHTGHPCLVYSLSPPRQGLHNWVWPFLKFIIGQIFRLWWILCTFCFILVASYAVIQSPDVSSCVYKMIVSMGFFVIVCQHARYITKMPYHLSLDSFRQDQWSRLWWCNIIKFVTLHIYCLLDFNSSKESNNQTMIPWLSSLNYDRPIVASASQYGAC